MDTRTLFSGTSSTTSNAWQTTLVPEAVTLSRHTNETLPTTTGHFLDLLEPDLWYAQRWCADTGKAKVLLSVSAAKIQPTPS